MRALYRNSTAAAGFAFCSGATLTANTPFAAPSWHVSKTWNFNAWKPLSRYIWQVWHGVSSLGARHDVIPTLNK